ncbi:MAG: efflux RND transporter permease subunit [Eggerthellaceae bacterium]
MLPRFSVLKPFYVLAAAIIVLALGAYSLTYLKTDLYPEMDIPYMAVITTYPGASPEKVEEDVTDPLEEKLATLSGVDSVSSQSSENFSMIFLAFVDGTDMDSALVKVSAAVNQVTPMLPDDVGTPTYMEMSADAVATAYVGVALDGKTQAETSKYVQDTLIPALQRQDGIASVSGVGLVSDTVNVELNQSKIDDVNNRLLASVNDKLYDAKKQIDEGKSQVAKAKQELEDQEKSLSDQQASTADELASASSGLTTAISATTAQITALSAAITSAQAYGQDTKELEEQLAAAQDQLAELQEQLSQVNAGSVNAAAGFGSATAQIAAAKQTLQASEADLKDAESQYEASRKQAIESANIDALLDISTLSQLISAQNFSMPAGYVKDDSDGTWLLKVGEEYTTAKELKNTVLTNIDGVGDIRIKDVADVTTLSNEGDIYAKLNGTDGIIVSVTKSSTAATSDVSAAVQDTLEDLQSEDENLKVMYLYDQGKYINLFITTILQSLLMGIVLAVIVLALFLKSVRPTLVIAFSIPFSVLFALTLMYFWGLDVNIMTLSALSLGIGMLVDNSVVVLENIYRLRARGLTAERSAAQGAKQVAGAVTASTLTTICVFLPFVFTTGLVNQMLVPFALTLSFALLASLLVALTCVPALGAKLFANHAPREVIWFERLKQAYGRAIAWCLKHKAPVLVGATALAVFCLVSVLQMGISMVPNMTSNQIGVTVVMPEDSTKDEAIEVADTITDRLLQIDGIQDVGSADSSAMGSVMSGGMSMGSGSASDDEEDRIPGFMFYATVDKEKVHTEDQMAALQEQVKQAGEGLDCEFMADASAMSSSMLKEQLEIQLTGDDPQALLDASQQVMDTVDSVEGYIEIENGQEDADPVLQLVFDKNKVAALGTTVAQIYQQLAGKLNTSTTAITMGVGDDAQDVNLISNRNEITKETLLDTEFTVSSSASGTQETKTYKLSKVATVEEKAGLSSLTSQNGTYIMKVTAEPDEGENLTLLSRQLQPKLADLQLPDGVEMSLEGTDSQVADMIQQMLQLMALGLLLIYLIMMAQFGSFVAPFIIILTVPLAFTGGVLALLIAGQGLDVMSLMGFVVLMGVIVNNGIVFVDFANKLRRQGMEKRSALIATGMTRMRPIMMTAATTIFAMLAMIFNPEIGASAERGMALVVTGGLLYGTLTTLFVVPIVYDLLWRKPMKIVDLGPDVDEVPDDAGEFISQMGEDAKGGLYELNEEKKERRRLRAERRAQKKR